MDLTGFSKIVENVKTAISTVKQVVDLRNDYELHKATHQLLTTLDGVRNQLTSLQSEYATMQRSKDDMEKKLVELIQWKEDKARYELAKLPSGTLVYRLKTEYQDVEPAHDLCPRCYNKNVKSVLQFGGYKDSHSTLQCLNPDCGAVVLNERQEQRAYSVPRSDRGGW